MIDMNSFGVNLEPCRRDVVIGSKVRRAQTPARHHLVVLAKHVFDGHVPIGKCDQQLPNESLHGGKTFHRLEPSSKIYEIVGEDIVELVERARVGSVMIAMKQFERLLIVHLPLPAVASKPHIGTLQGLPEAVLVSARPPAQQTRGAGCAQRLLLHDGQGALNVDAGVYAQIDATWKAQLNIENIFNKG